MSKNNPQSKKSAKVKSEGTSDLQNAEALAELDSKQIGVLRSLEKSVSSLTNKELGYRIVDLKEIQRDLEAEVDNVKTAASEFITKKFPGFDVKSISGVKVSQMVLGSQLLRVINSEISNRAEVRAKGKKTTKEVDDSLFRDALKL